MSPVATRPAAAIETPSRPASDASTDEEPLWPLLVVALLLAACSIVYELLAAQTLSMLAANTVVWYSLTVGIFLASMGAGAFLSKRLIERVDARVALFRVEIALTAVGVSVVPVIHAGHMGYLYGVVNELGVLGPLAFFSAAFVVVAAVGVLTGLELPLLMSIARGFSPRPETNHTVLGVDYLGSLVGALAFPLLLLPRLSLLEIGLVVAAENLAVAICIAWSELRGRMPMRRAAIPCALLGGLLVAFGLGVHRSEMYFMRKYYYYLHCGGSVADLFAPMGEFPPILRGRSPYQRIDLVKDVAPDYMASMMPAYSTKLEHEPDYPQDWILFLNGDFQTNTTFDEVYHEWFAHVPIASTGQVPREVLVLGGGDGLLMRELVKYDGIETITHVDIDPVLIELAKEQPVLRSANNSSMHDPRIERILGDGFQFARRTARRFDAVFIDFPAAVDYDLAKLYSREFFHFVRRIVKPDGWCVFDATGIGVLSRPEIGEPQRFVGENDWPVYANTLRAAGWGTIEPYVTTLELENERVPEVLQEAGVSLDVGPRAVAMLQAAETEEERQTVTKLILRELTEVHVYMLQQGFIMMSPGEESPFTEEWHDPGVPMHLLNEERFGLAFGVDFPRSPEIRWAYVNSILRPTFPTTSVWRPRQPY